MSQRQYIGIGIGGSGVKINNQYWDYMYDKYILQSYGDPSLQNRFFCETDSNTQSIYIPRTIYIDEDFEDIQRIIKNDNQKNKIFNKNNAVYCKSTNGDGIFNNCYLVSSREILEQINQLINKEVEKCDQFGGFYTIYNTKGGAGGGLRAQLSETISSYYPKKDIVDFSIWPETTQKDNTVVGILNSILSLNYNSDNNINILFQNSKIYQILEEQAGIEYPSQQQLNEYIANSIIFTMEQEIQKLSESLIPLPQQNFVTSSISQLPQLDINPEIVTESTMTKQALSSKSQSINVKFNEGSLISSSLNYLGDTNITNILQRLKQLIKQNKMQGNEQNENKLLVRYNKRSNFLHNQTNLKLPKNLHAITNHKSIQLFLKDIQRQFQTLYEKRAFAFWYYSCGVSEGQFEESESKLAHIIQCYEEE